MDIDVLASYAKMFGLGSKTEVSLPRETTGLIPTKEWKLKKNGIPWQKERRFPVLSGSLTYSLLQFS